MQESAGILDLRIARLEHRLRVLAQQYSLSSPYPAHQANLFLEYSRVQFQLNQLAQQRRQFLQPTLAAN